MSVLDLVLEQKIKAVDRSFWSGKRVLLTGHTGFKGGWLAIWLADMGAQVIGYALAPDTVPSLYVSCGLDRKVESNIGDVRDIDRLAATVKDCEPEIVFHLAAQALVLRSYREPKLTFDVNVTGTVNVLEAIRSTSSVRSAVIVTSDKCYQEREGTHEFCETDPIGGRDPYSASKAAAESVVTAYQRSFFQNSPNGPAVATARAGNVIGGGDWAADRIIPDTIRALAAHKPVELRNPRAVRPWQHVLEPLAGYLMLAEKLHQHGSEWSGAWNFGPGNNDELTTSGLTEMVLKRWGGGSWRATSNFDQPHESHYLKLNCSKARRILGWTPKLAINEAVAMTVDWYRDMLENAHKDCLDLSLSQLRDYEKHSARAFEAKAS